MKVDNVFKYENLTIRLWYLRCEVETTPSTEIESDLKTNFYTGTANLLVVANKCNSQKLLESTK